MYDAGVMPHDPESFGEFLKYRTGARLGADVARMIEAADGSRVSDLYPSMPIRG